MSLPMEESKPRTMDSFTEPSLVRGKPTDKKQPHLFLLNFLGVFVLTAGILAVLFFSSRNKTEIQILEAEQAQESELVVDLQGAVQHPGIYKLKSDSRMNDLLVAAGGLSEEADREWFSKNINLAQKLSDGIKIYVPFQGETGRVSQGSSGQVAGLASETFGEKININLASSAELERLSGIGPVTAGKIINYRLEFGPFASIEEIMKVPGIGEKTFEKIRNQITVW